MIDPKVLNCKYPWYITSFDVIRPGMNILAGNAIQYILVSYVCEDTKYK